VTPEERELAEAERIASTYKPGVLPTPNDPDPKRRADGVQIQKWREARAAYEEQEGLRKGRTDENHT